MIKLNKSTQYAIYILTCLIESDKQLSMREMIAGTKLPKRLMVRVAAVLSSAGIIKSKEGRTGGYVVVNSSLNMWNAISFIGLFQKTKLKNYTSTINFVINLLCRMSDISLGYLLSYGKSI